MYLSPENLDENKEINEFVNLINKEKTWKEIDLDDHYILNRETFDKNRKVYDEINPECILQTAVVLPFYLPIEDSFFTIPFYAFRNNGRCTLSLHFSTIEDEIIFTGGFVQSKGIKYYKKRTRIEINCLFIEDLYISKEQVAYSVLNIAKYVNQINKNEEVSDENFLEAVNKMFEIKSNICDSALQLINSFILVHAKVYNCDTIYCISIENVEHISHFRIIEPKKWSTYNWMSINNTHFVHNQTPKIDDEVMKIFKDVNKTHANYYEEYSKYYQRGLFEYQNGNITSSIMYLVISIEVLLTKIFRMYYKEYKKLDEQKITEKLNDTTFKKLLNSEMPKIIGGNWKLDKKSKIPGIWYKDTYELRGRTVHAGYVPTEKEITSSIKQTSDLIKYIFDLMNKKKKKLKDLIKGFYTPYL